MAQRPLVEGLNNLAYQRRWNYWCRSCEVYIFSSKINDDGNKGINNFKKAYNYNK